MAVYELKIINGSPQRVDLQPLDKFLHDELERATDAGEQLPVQPYETTRPLANGKVKNTITGDVYEPSTSYSELAYEERTNGVYRD